MEASPEQLLQLLPLVRVGAEVVDEHVEVVAGSVVGGSHEGKELRDELLGLDDKLLGLASLPQEVQRFQQVVVAAHRLPLFRHLALEHLAHLLSQRLYPFEKGFVFLA